MTAPQDEGWRRKDAWTGLMFLCLGVLLVAYAVLAFRNGVPMVLWGTTVLLGPLLVLLGVNAIVRALRAGR